MIKNNYKHFPKVMSREDWNKSLETLQRQLGEAEYEKLIQIPDFETFNSHIEKLCTAYADRTVTRCIRGLDSSFQSLRTFVMVVSTMVQANPAIAALVWGSILAVLQVCLSSMIMIANETRPSGF